MGQLRWLEQAIRLARIFVGERCDGAFTWHSSLSFDVPALLPQASPLALMHCMLLTSPEMVMSRKV